MISRRNSFANREELAAGLARDIAIHLSAAVTAHGNAVLAVSGGTTPVLLFNHLSRAEITWDRITVTLVDERQVPEDSPRSNAGLVKRHLLNGRAAPARFVPLFNNPAAMELPAFAVCVLGMGTDGHTASFFPGGDTLAEAIDPKSEKKLISISAPDSGEPRITFTLPHLVASRFLALHIEGKEKREVLARAESGSDPHEYPVRAVLQAAPVHLYWCP